MRQVSGSLLWIGNAGDARNFSALFAQEIKAVIDLAVEEAPTQLPRELVYCRIPLIDGPGNVGWLLQMGIAVTVKLLREKVPTLVACGMGMSRSPCIAATALAKVSGDSPDQCLASIVTTGSGDIAPGLWCDVVQAFRDLE